MSSYSILEKIKTKISDEEYKELENFWKGKKEKIRYKFLILVPWFYRCKIQHDHEKYTHHHPDNIGSRDYNDEDPTGHKASSTPDISTKPYFFMCYRFCSCIGTSNRGDKVDIGEYNHFTKESLKQEFNIDKAPTQEDSDIKDYMATHETPYIILSYEKIRDY